MERQSVATPRQADRQKNALPSARTNAAACGPSHPLLEFQRTIGNQAVGRVIQAKLRINEPGDIYEQEADRVAEQVMRMRVPTSVANQITPLLQRQVHIGGDETLLTKNGSGEPSIASPSVEGHIKGLNGGGVPLTQSARSFFEPRFGRDFSDVRVHSGAQAADAARAVNALAYTVGRDVVFGAGQYAPMNSEGRKLLAHELTHVVQQSEPPQRAGVVQRQSGGTGPAPSSPPASATVFHPGVNHGHTPSGRWADVQANPNSGFWENRVCANFSPNIVVGIAINREFSNKPLALDHLNWYLGNGHGADYVEDTNIDALLRTDAGVQALLAGLIPSSAPAGGRLTGHVKVEQSDYQSQDYRYAFGAIDRLDFEVDFAAGTVHVWLQDRYDWHPVYPGLYTAFPDDVVRETNCVHAALVELQAGGARDFWMKGEATVPLSLFRRAPAGGGGGGGGGSL